MATWGAGKRKADETGRGKALGPVATIAARIVFIRGQRVMLDADLALLYGVPTMRLNEQVRRNRARFPEDFMFQITRQELGVLRSQFAISSWGGRRYRPFAFTEQGVAMLSGVLHSRQAVRVNVEIMRAFVRLRAAASVHHRLAERLAELERVVGSHDQSIRAVFIALKQLMSPPYRRKRRIGFLAHDRNA